MPKTPLKTIDAEFVGAEDIGAPPISLLARQSVIDVMKMDAAE